MISQTAINNTLINVLQYLIVHFIIFIIYVLWLILFDFPGACILFYSSAHNSEWNEGNFVSRLFISFPKVCYKIGLIAEVGRRQQLFL